MKCSDRTMVDRYEMYWDHDRELAYMIEKADGEFVLHSDYAELEAENERQATSIEILRRHALEWKDRAVAAEALSRTGAVDTLAEVRTTLDAALLSADPYRYIRAALSALEPAEPELCDDEGCPHHGTPHVCITRPSEQAVTDEMVAAALQEWFKEFYQDGRLLGVSATYDVHSEMRAALKAAMEARR